jgi:hypothetical protein
VEPRRPLRCNPTVRLATALVATALVLGVGSAAAKRSPVLATVWKGSVVSLTRVDPMSLRPVGGRSLPIGGGAYLVARSPRGATLAFDTDRGAVLSFVDSETLRLRGSTTLGEGWTSAAAWPSAGRVVAVLGSEGGVRLVVVDPAAHRQLLVRRLPLRDDLLASAATANRVVFLLSESPDIASVRLAVAGADGAIRSVLLAQIRGGTQSPTEGDGVVKTAWPALAVDPSGRRAAVVAAAGLVAEVDLETLAVTYHPRGVRVPARAAKALQGWERYAVWLPSGALAVTGMDYDATVQDGTKEMTGTPAGLTFVDTRDWSSTVVDQGASFLARAGSLLVVYGGALTPGPSSGAGIGLRGYGPDGTLRFELFGAEQIGEVQVAGTLVYVSSCNDRCFRIVDATTGELAGTASTSDAVRLVAR